MAVDYDRPREDDTDVRPFATTSRGTSPDVSDDADNKTAAGWELTPGALDGDETAVVIPQQAGEFT